jgi:hypothetical protein
VCPVLLASKVVLFNWKDSLQRDRLLNLLGVMQRAAYNVSDEEDAAGDAGGAHHMPDCLLWSDQSSTSLMVARAHSSTVCSSQLSASIVG